MDHGGVEELTRDRRREREREREREIERDSEPRVARGPRVSATARE